MLGQTSVQFQTGEGRWGVLWPPPIPHPGSAEGCALAVGQGAEEALGKELGKAALLHWLSPRMSGPHFQGDLWLPFWKKDLIVDHPHPSGLEPAGEYQALMCWAVEEARR